MVEEFKMAWNKVKRYGVVNPQQRTASLSNIHVALYAGKSLGLYRNEIFDKTHRLGTFIT